jgi:acyl carrier protein
MMPEDDFLALLRREFSESVEARIDKSSRLIDDLALDSLELIRLLLIAESLVPGFDLPEQLELADVTVGDVYHYMAQRAAQAL